MVEQKKTVDLENRKKALELALAQIEKQFGKGSIMRMDGATHLEIEVIPTGCLALDLALGVGGVPRGRVIEIYGPESSGKTTLTLSIIPRSRKSAVRRLLSTRNTRSMRPTPAKWESNWMNF